MNFVGDQPYAVAIQYVPQGAKLVLRPGVSHGIMGVAQQHHLGSVLAGGLDRVQIHAVAAVRLTDQRAVRQLTVAVADAGVKRAVTRRLHDHLVAGFGQGQHRRPQTRDHAGQHQLLLRRHRQPVSALEKAQHGFHG